MELFSGRKELMHMPSTEEKCRECRVESYEVGSDE